MNTDFNVDSQRITSDELPNEKIVERINAYEGPVKVAEIVDDFFQDMSRGNAEIRKLKDWTFAKIVLGKFLVLMTSPLIVLASAVFSFVGIIYFGINSLFGNSKSNSSILYDGIKSGSDYGFKFGSLGSWSFLMNSVQNLKEVHCVEKKFNTQDEENFNFTDSEKALFPNGLDYKLQRINKCTAEVEAKLENPARGTFIFNFENHKYVFEAMYCFDNYYGGTNPWYKRILKVCNGVNENNEHAGYGFFGDDKFKVNSIKYADGKLVLEMDSPLRPKKGYHSEQRFIELELS